MSPVSSALELQALLPAEKSIIKGQRSAQAYSRLYLQSAVAIGFEVVILRVQNSAVDTMDEGDKWIARGGIQPWSL